MNIPTEKTTITLTAQKTITTLMNMVTFFLVPIGVPEGSGHSILVYSTPILENYLPQLECPQFSDFQKFAQTRPDSRVSEKKNTPVRIARRLLSRASSVLLYEKNVFERKKNVKN